MRLVDSDLIRSDRIEKESVVLLKCSVVNRSGVLDLEGASIGLEIV